MLLWAAVVCFSDLDGCFDCGCWVLLFALVKLLVTLPVVLIWLRWI